MCLGQHFLAEMIAPRVLAIAARRWTSVQAPAVAARPKRFYREVSVVEQREGTNNAKTPTYGIMLDNREMKTPAGKDFRLQSKSLATAIGREWDSQDECINKAAMHLTGLAYTAIDNPYEETSESISSRVLGYLSNDTLLYFASEPEGLVKLQKEKWAPVIRQANSVFRLDLRATQNIIDSPEVQPQSLKLLEDWLKAHNFSSLVGLQYSSEAVKSVLLAISAFVGQLEAEEVVELARLEQIYQTRIWGNVEWSHDVEYQESCARFAAGIIFAKLSSTESA